jgi:hypothetical protein
VQGLSALSLGIEALPGYEKSGPTEYLAFLRQRFVLIGQEGGSSDDGLEMITG